jgi:hypothetical protein
MSQHLRAHVVDIGFDQARRNKAGAQGTVALFDPWARWGSTTADLWLRLSR